MKHIEAVTRQTRSDPGFRILQGVREEAAEKEERASTASSCRRTGPPVPHLPSLNP